VFGHRNRRWPWLTPSHDHGALHCNVAAIPVLPRRVDRLNGPQAIYPTVSPVTIPPARFQHNQESAKRSQLVLFATPW
jgi:hypothetical protein